MGHKSSRRPRPRRALPGQDAEQVTELAGFLFPRFNAEQKIPRLSSPSFLHEVARGASEGRGGAGQSRGRRTRERAPDGDIPGMPRAASPWQVRAVQKTTRGGEKERE